MLELLAIAELVLAPLALTVRDRMVDRLATVVTDASAGKVRSWLDGVAEQTASRDELRDELASDPELANQVRRALQTLPYGGPMPEAEDVPASNSTEQQLDAYAEVLYQLALSAIWTKRPVVIEGFLQGPEWIAICDPGDWRGDTGRIPAPTDLWVRFAAADPVLERNGFLGAWTLASSGPGQSLTYRIRYSPEAKQRAAAKAALERQFRLEPTSTLPDDVDDIPVDSRWHEVLRIRPFWVQLQPSGAEFEERGLLKRADVLLNRVAFSQYPKAWQDLMEIADPAEGITSVRRSTISVLQADAEFQSRIKQALSIT